MTRIRPTFYIAALAMLSALTSLPAMAQRLESINVDPAAAAVGQPVTLTAQFDISKGLNCNVRIRFGDGKQDDFSVNQTKDATMTMKHVYDKPGNYNVDVEPRRKLPLPGCLGDQLHAKVVVAAPVVAAASAPAKSAGTSPCPSGWKLVAKSQNKKTGAFQCSAKPGSAAPATKPECPGQLNYVENLKKGQLGCRP
jgi:PKD domain